jgi:hypothetical protein
MSNSLAIAHIHNRCHLLGESIETATIVSQLNRLSSEVLPQLIAQELDRQLPASEFDSRIYRINRLHVSFSLLKQDLQTNLAGNMLASRLVQALCEQLQNKPDNLKCYKNQAEYIAAFIADLLKGTAWNQWQYQEFAALKYVEQDEAAIQVLLARGELLAPLVSALHQQGTMGQLLSVITHTRAQTLFEQWAGVNVQQVFSEQVSLLQVNVWLQALGPQLGHQAASQESLLMATVKTFLRGIQNLPEQSNNVNAALIAMTQLVFVARHKALVALCLKQSKISASSIRPQISALPADEQQVMHSLIAFLAMAENNEEHIKQVLTYANGYAIKDTPEKIQPGDSTQKTVTFGRSVYCPHAGVILLIPVIISIDLLAYYPNHLLRGALLTIADASEGDMAYSWLDWLLPDAENDGDLHPDGLPASLQLGLNKEQRSELANLNGQPELQLVRLLTMQFALRLSGLQLSSSAYLNQEFLHISGNIQQDEQGISVLLSPIALNIVLSMSGFSPWQQTLKWLDKSLNIEVRS